MSIERATGLVLRTLQFTETSLIVRWLTPTWGRVSTIAKGARRPKSPFLGKLDLFYEVDFTFSRSRTSALHILREADVRNSNEGLRKDYHRLCQVAYCARLIECTTEEETPLPAPYALLRDLVTVVSLTRPNPLLVLAFELKLLAESGLNPDWSKTVLAPETVALGLRLLNADFQTIAQSKIDTGPAQELAKFMGNFIQYHFGRIPGNRRSVLVFGP